MDGSFMNIGNLIQNRRKLLGLTQKQLAKGICTQAMISKIERNLMNPSSILLKEIADRLNVTTSYFFNENPHTTINVKTETLVKQIQDHLNQTQYEEVKNLVNNNLDFIELINQTEQAEYIQYFKWIEANLDYYYYNNKETAVNKLHNLLNSEGICSKTKINTLGSLGIIHYEEKEHEQAHEYFINCIELFDKNITYKEKAKILYNYALNLTVLDQVREALEIVLQGIELLLNNQSIYMLGYFYYLRGVLFEKIEDYYEALESFNTASTIFKMLDYSKMYGMSRIEIQRIKGKEEI